MGRGRKPRAEARAEATIKARVTLDELRIAKAIARANDCTLAELLRIELYVGSLNAGTPAPEIVGQELINQIFEHELARRRGLQAVHEKGSAVQSSRQELKV